MSPRLALMQPHLQQTREQATASAVVLLVQDTTDIDLSHRHKISGVGHIGNERGRGCFVQTVLAVRTRDPRSARVPGEGNPLYAFPLQRREQRHQRRKREERETDVWMRQVQAIGTPDPGSMWVHFGDRGADLFPFCRGMSDNQDALSGASGEVTACPAGRRRDHVFSDACTRLSESGQSSVRGESPTWAPSAFDPVAAGLWANDALATARHEPRAGKDPVRVWVIGVWEEQARDAEEPLEWMKFPSVPTTTLDQAWERVDWYRHRWLVEDSHHCLTSGCRIEERQGPPVDGLIRRLGSVIPSCRTLVADPWRRALRTRAPGEGVHFAFHLRLSHVGKHQA